MRRETTHAREVEDRRQAVRTILLGLVPLHIARITSMSPYKRDLLREEATNLIAGHGDRVVEPANFADRKERGKALSALASGLAILAFHAGGVTWIGLHWCTSAHADCPHTPEGCR